MTNMRGLTASDLPKVAERIAEHYRRELGASDGKWVRYRQHEEKFKGRVYHSVTFYFPWYRRFANWLKRTPLRKLCELYLTDNGKLLCYASGVDAIGVQEALFDLTKRFQFTISMRLL
jgi:CRISPR/Cas system-associated protein Cas10 (large subunit of type III CRISPR-Cas system)